MIIAHIIRVSQHFSRHHILENNRAWMQSRSADVTINLTNIATRGCESKKYINHRYYIARKREPFIRLLIP